MYHGTGSPKKHRIKLLIGDKLGLHGLFLPRALKDDQFRAVLDLFGPREPFLHKVYHSHGGW